MKLPMRGPWAEPSRVSYSAWNQWRSALERVALADFEDEVLDRFGIGVAGQARQLRIEVAQRRRFFRRGRPPLEVRG